jgi:hypothetical protein
VSQGIGAGVVRKAADPGVVERIASFLGDNALTRSWAESVDNAVIRPVERMAVDDEGLKTAIYNQIARLTPDAGGLSEKQLQLLSAIKGSPANAELLNAHLATAPDRRKFVLDQGYSLIENAKPSREQMLGVFDQIASDGRTGLTKAGDYVRQFGLGSPVAAYSAVTAGGAMGAAAAMEAYDWWMAQQQQAQKDAQLPLQGSAITG